MSFQLSPGVVVIEKDLTAIVPAVSTSTGGFVGKFRWGAIEVPISVSSENELIKRFGKPHDLNADSFFTAANFLSYANSLLLVRSDAVGLRNSVAVKSGSVTGISLSNIGVYPEVPDVTLGAPQVSGGVQATATATRLGGILSAINVGGGGTGYTSANISITAPQVSGGVQATATATLSSGVIISATLTNPGSGYTSAPTVTVTGDGTGASLTATVTNGGISITLTNPGSGYTSAPTVTIEAPSSGTQAVATSSIVLAGVKIKNNDHYIQSYIDGGGVFGEVAAKCAGSLGNSLRVMLIDSTNWSTLGSQYKNNFESAPGTSDYVSNMGGSLDEMHILVIDEGGLWTGTSGTILEKFSFVSKASDAKKGDGTNNYYKNVLNSKSEFVYWLDHPTEGTNWGSEALNVTFTTLSTVVSRVLSGGVDDYDSSDGDLINAWDIFVDAEQYDLSLLPLGRVSTTVVTHVINNVVEVRKDCVCFISPLDVESGDILIGNSSENIDKIVEFRDELPSTSYACMDSGYKYQYDKYNDKYRFVPLNGDIAGLSARTDYTNDPWWSPAGLNRGQIKNVIKLAVNPNKSQRDTLYKSGINPVVTFPGEGTVLYGDKTLLSKPSAFDRINVRRLFIVLEKAIAVAAKYQLFEFNDSFTRSQFRNLVEPYLRDIKGRRGLIDFLVKCDTSNNTPEVIDRNEFVADIFVKPNRVINNISLNVIATRTGVSFTELTQ